MNHIGDTEADYVKMEFYIYLMISGFFILFKKPPYILMLLPIIFQKMFHDRYVIWSTYGQYSIEFVVIMVIGIFTVISEIKSDKLRKIIMYFIVMANLAVTIRVMDNAIVHHGRERIRIYKSVHYQRKFDVKALHQQLKKIPKDAIISAQSPFVPHLALRDHIYQFPMIDDAEYIVLSFEESPYPLTESDFKMKMKSILQSNKWEIIYEAGPIRIGKRK